jgi:DNA polymerase-3 subunit epsilon
LFTVVDIETTGGTVNSHRIIEVAIVTVDGGQIVDQYETLINPQRYIPPFITSLTGITNEMVERAPAFAEVANTILIKLKEKYLSLIMSISTIAFSNRNLISWE